MVYHVNDCVAVASNLIYQLNTRMDAVDRAMEMYDRLAKMPADQALPRDIVEFIDAYSMYCDGLEELQNPTPKTALSEVILSNLKVAMERIMKTLNEVLNVLTNSQARNKRIFDDMLISIGQRSRDPEVVHQFESIPCKVLAQSEAVKALEKCMRLVDIVKFVAGSNTIQAATNVVQTGQAPAGIAFNNGMITDMYTSVSAGTYNSFKDSGWTIVGLTAVIRSHIDCLNAIDSIRGCQKSLKAMASALQADIANISKTGVCDNAKLIQERISFQLFAVRTVSAGVAILIKRVAAVSNIIKAINLELERAALERAKAGE